MMNPRRSSKVAVASCGTFVLAIWVVGSLIVIGSAGVEGSHGAHRGPPRSNSHGRRRSR